MVGSNVPVDGSLDAVLNALESPHRRAVIDHFADTCAPIGLDDLADVVASGTDAASPEAVLVALHHAHLPKLESVGLVAVDHDDRTVEPTADAAEFERLGRAVTALSAP